VTVVKRPLFSRFCPFQAVTQVSYNTCVTVVGHPFLPPWRSCVIPMEDGEQGVFSLNENSAGARCARPLDDAAGRRTPAQAGT